VPVQKEKTARKGYIGSNSRLYPKCPEIAKQRFYLFPTYGEGMPNSVLEAMAYGLPVVTRPVGGLRDFFENGRMGFVADSLEPFEFMGLMEKLVLDSGLRDKMGQYNRTYAKDHFSATKVAARLENIYEKLIAHGTDK
jgi:glycosyltransferase involved in cell wall biosynthesis